MFYESIVHQVKEVGSAREAARLIKEGNESSCNALSWETKNGSAAWRGAGLLPTKPQTKYKF